MNATPHETLTETRAGTRDLRVGADPLYSRSAGLTIRRRSTIPAASASSPT